MKGQEQEQVFLWVRDAVGDVAEVKRDYVFLPHRKFELDVAIPSAKLGIEVDGFGGGHQLPKGWLRDREKDLVALGAGWHVARVATAQVRDGSAFLHLEPILIRYVEGLLDGR